MGNLSESLIIGELLNQFYEKCQMIDFYVSVKHKRSDVSDL